MIHDEAGHFPPSNRAALFVLAWLPKDGQLWCGQRADLVPTAFVGPAQRVITSAKSSTFLEKVLAAPKIPFRALIVEAWHRQHSINSVDNEKQLPKQPARWNGDRNKRRIEITCGKIAIVMASMENSRRSMDMFATWFRLLSQWHRFQLGLRLFGNSVRIARDFTESVNKHVTFESRTVSTKSSGFFSVAPDDSMEHQ